MADVVIAGATILRKLSRQRRQHCPRGKLQKSAVGNLVHTSAEGVIDLALQAMAQALCGGELQAVVMAGGAGGKRRDRAEPGIGRLQVREGRETSIADFLITVYLRQIRLI